MTWTVVEDDGPDADSTLAWCVLDKKGVLLATVHTEALARQIALLPDLIENNATCLTAKARELRSTLAEIDKEANHER